MIFMYKTLSSFRVYFIFVSFFGVVGGRERGKYRIGLAA